jgi:hypothetical protein
LLNGVLLGMHGAVYLAPGLRDQLDVELESNIDVYSKTARTDPCLNRCAEVALEHTQT